MQFSSRYDGRRLQTRPSSSLARSFKSLVDWFDYAYAVVPAAAAWVRHPSFRMRGTHSPAVIHLRGPFSQDGLANTPEVSNRTPRQALHRQLVKGALFSAALAGVYFAFVVATGGASQASAPSPANVATTAAFDIRSGIDSPTQKVVEVLAAGEPAQTATIATPVKTLQSAIVAAAAAPIVTAAETSAEAVKPAPVPIVVAAVTPAATAPPVPTVTAPIATPAADRPPVLASRSASTVYTVAEIRVFAAAAGWDSAHLDDVVQVAQCESSNNAAATSWAGAYGLMQIMPFWFREAGVDFATWADPVSNLKVALVAYHAGIAESKGPWSAWACQPSHSS